MSSKKFLEHSGAQFPIICGAMYPCSNPELIAAVSEAGGIGIIQPLSLTYVHGYEIREGIRKIKNLTKRPVGFNMLIETSSKAYRKRMEYYLDVALEEGIRFFVTALGNPRWVVQKVEKHQAVVYHDVINRDFGQRVLDKGVSGLICVNNRAGGHLGKKSAEELYQELADLGLPLVCAGGVSTRSEFEKALGLGYEAVQMGTRFIATTECQASEVYKQAIVKAEEKDIVTTERVTGVSLSVINNDYVQRVGTKANFLFRALLKHPKTKHWMRFFYIAISFIKLKQSNFRSNSTRDYWQAGKSVAGIHEIKSVRKIIKELTQLKAPKAL